MSVDEVKAGLRRGNEHAREGKERLESAIPTVAEAAAAIRHTVGNSQNENVQAALQGLTAVEKELPRTLRRFEAAVGAAEWYLERL